MVYSIQIIKLNVHFFFNKRCAPIDAGANPAYPNAPDDAPHMFVINTPPDTADALTVFEVCVKNLNSENLFVFVFVRIAIGTRWCVDEQRRIVSWIAWINIRT